MDVGSSFVADAQAAVLVEAGEGALNDPALAAEAGAVFAALLGDQRSDPFAAQVVAGCLPLVAAVAEDGSRAAFRPAALAAHGRNRLDERDQLGAVVAVGGGEQAGEWDPAGVRDQLVLGAALAPVDRAGAGFGAPKTAGR